ncbi:MAG: FtsQ-type POTRA domain-containing protein [Deltaproteobacteria bacterium]|nr:MAG: FtsQ-type POTRA domain-containing protein [Deltaproteobacteria bacterium]
MKKKPRKTRSVLKKQAVKKRKRKTSPNMWRLTRFLFSYSFKFSCLLAGLVFISLLFLYLYENLLTSPFIRLERVIVDGVDGNLKHALLKMSELKPDTSLLSVQLDEMKRRMEKHPWIRSVNLEKRFPHTLVIKAEKEEPCAIVVLDNLHYMNRWGKIFRRLDETAHMDFPLVTGISKSGSEGEKQLQLAAGVLRVLEGGNGPWSLEELSEVHVEKTGHISLYFLSLPAVIELEATQLERQMEDLKRLVQHLKRTGRLHMVKRIDLNYREGAIVSYKNDGVVS